MRYLIIGGERSGKSDYAEDRIKLLATGKPLYYIATMIPFDEEDHNRIKKHQLHRMNKGFNTLEIGTDILSLKNKIGKDDYFLLDSLTALVLNEMFKHENDLTLDELENKLILEFSELINYYHNFIIVADDIFSNSETFTNFTNDYLKLYGHLLTKIAQQVDNVIEMKSGLKIIHKGSEE